MLKGLFHSVIIIIIIIIIVILSNGLTCRLTD